MITSRISDSGAGASLVEQLAESERTRRTARISICIPTYNYGQFLGDAIRSVLAQTFADFELIVCDNASTDDTPEIVAKFSDPRLRYLRHRINVPVIYNFNRCLELVNSEFVLLLCADDMLAPQTIALLHDALVANPTAAMAVASQCRPVDASGNPRGKPNWIDCGPGLVAGRDALVWECTERRIMGIPSQILVRTEAILRHGGFDPQTGIHCDVDLYCRMCEDGDLVYVPEAWFYLRLHAATETRRRCDDLRETKARLLFVERLFRQSAALRENRHWQRAFVRNRLYASFAAALDHARRGDLRHLLWLSWRTWKLDPVPWWFPRFLGRYTQDRIRGIGCRLAGRRQSARAVPSDRAGSADRKDHDCSQ